MNTLEPVTAFIDERLNELRRLDSSDLLSSLKIQARIDELEMIRNLCTGLIEQDKLLQNALAR